MYTKTGMIRRSITRNVLGTKRIARSAEDPCRFIGIGIIHQGRTRNAGKKKPLNGMRDRAGTVDVQFGFIGIGTIHLSIT
jgi:hypothetical protein